MVVETVRVVAGSHGFLVQPVGAAGEPLDDVGDLFAGEQFFDGQTHDRQPRSAASVSQCSGAVRVGAPLRPRAGIEPGAVDAGGLEREQRLARRDAGAAVDDDVLAGPHAERLERLA